MKFYKRGEVDLQRFPTKYGRYVTLRREKRLGEAERVRKARLTVDKDWGYSRKSMQDLIRECRANSFAIGITHVIRLLSLPAGSERNELQRKAIQGKWTRRQLDLAIRLQCGIRRRWARRHVRPPRDKAEALWLVERNCDHWTRLCAAVIPAKGRSLLPHEVVNRMRSIAKSVTQVTALVERSLKKVALA
jgi:hypothetical protein